MGVVQAPFSLSPTGGSMIPGQSYEMQAGATSGGSFGQGFAEAMTVAGPVIGIFGAVTSAIGSYYAAENQKNQLKMQAQNQRFAADMSRINQRGAEYTATQIGQAGARQFGAYSMQAGQQRASTQAALASRGGVLNVGSNRDIVGSMDLIKEIDRLNISASTVRAQEAAKLQAFNLGTQATMMDLSAQNLSTSASTINSGMALGTSLLGSATDIATSWARNKRIEELLAGVSTRRI